MKVILLKNHLDNQEGETIDVTEQRAIYLVRVGVAKQVIERKNKKRK